MKKKDLNDSELIELLHQLPSVEDHRSMNEVYSSVINGARRTKKGIVRPIKRYVFPSLATVACIFLAILGFNIFNANFSGHESANDANFSKSAEHHTDSLKGKDQLAKHDIAEEKQIDEGNKNLINGNFGNGKISKNESDENFTLMMNNEQWKSPVLEDFVKQGYYSLTIGLPDNNYNYMVPVSFIVRGTEGTPWIDQYNGIMSLINEESLGFADFYPISGNFSLDRNGEVNLNLSKNHPYNFGSASEMLLLKSIEMLRFSGIKDIFLYENSVPGLKLSHTGEVNHHYELTLSPKNGYFIFETNAQNYLSPNNISYPDIESALEDMKEVVLDKQLLPSIPRHITFTVDNTDSNDLIINFSENSKLENTDLYRFMIDAILLTAHDFGYKTVHFRNSQINVIGPYNLTEPIKVPVAPNLIGSYE